MDKFYVIFSSDLVDQKVKILIDKGEVDEANRVYYGIKSLQKKLTDLLQEKGLTAYSTIPSRFMFECSESVAELIPQFFEGYQVEGRVACGIGFNWNEAAYAMSKSKQTGDIEFYDTDVNKNEPDDEIELPVNLSDPKSHEYYKLKPKAPNPILGPDAKQSMQLEQGYLGAIAQMFMPQMPQMPQQARPEQVRPEQARPEQKRSLYEMVTGEHKGDDQVQSAQQPEAKAESTEEPMTEETPEEKSDFDRLGASLVHLKEQIPQIMDLAEKNPVAFKQTMGLVQKMLGIAKQKVKKSELECEQLTEDLNKALRQHYPVGTVKHKRKKVIINGKAVWRSVGSGMIKDIQGNPISIRSHNAQQKDK